MIVAPLAMRANCTLDRSNGCEYRGDDHMSRMLSKIKSVCGCTVGRVVSVLAAATSLIVSILQLLQLLPL
ncbi:MAG: hypothetical protein CTY20_07915 [Hyphomicrobium sp.]|nr:MAG: hypothetical protein CTY20_07915 [Hyphomicrobium sp.]